MVDALDEKPMMHGGPYDPTHKYTNYLLKGVPFDGPKHRMWPGNQWWTGVKHHMFSERLVFSPRPVLMPDSLKELPREERPQRSLENAFSPIISVNDLFGGGPSPAPIASSVTIPQRIPPFNPTVSGPAPASRGVRTVIPALPRPSPRYASVDDKTDMIPSTVGVPNARPSRVATGIELPGGAIRPQRVEGIPSDFTPVPPPPAPEPELPRLRPRPPTTVPPVAPPKDDDRARQDSINTKIRRTGNAAQIPEGLIDRIVALDYADLRSSRSDERKAVMRERVAANREIYDMLVDGFAQRGRPAQITAVSTFFMISKAVAAEIVDGVP